MLFDRFYKKREGILWVSNDIFHDRNFKINDVEIFPFYSCEKAQRYLMSGKFDPKGALIGINPSQGNWGYQLLVSPGIQFANSLRAQYGERFPLAFFLDDGQIQSYGEKIFKETGVAKIFSMNQMNLTDVVGELLK